MKIIRAATAQLVKGCLDAMLDTKSLAGVTLEMNLKNSMCTADEAHKRWELS